MIKAPPLTLWLVAGSIVFVTLCLALLRWILPENLSLFSWLFLFFSLSTLTFSFSFLVSRRLLKNWQIMETAVLNLIDKNYSARLPKMGFSEFEPAREALNQHLDTLRNAHQSMQQKERFFDEIIAESQLSVLLFDRSQRIVYCNPSAIHLLQAETAASNTLTGKRYDEWLSSLPFTWQTSIASLFQHSGDTLLQASPPFPTENMDKDHTETADKAHLINSYHISVRHLNLYNHPHYFVLIREMTEQLARSEVETWKKAIRVLSHELNNSLAPISSMTHSAQLLVEKERWARIPQVLEDIKGNVQNLTSFIQRYAKFARLPKPNRSLVDWEPWLTQLQQQYAFRLPSIPDWPFEADVAQLSQVIINLLKNAHESGSSSEDIALSISQEQAHPTQPIAPNRTRFTLVDRGCGMSEDVLQQATLPFYSTKALGSGLGLALSREIVEAHGGHFWLHRRDGGGLEVGFSI